MPNSKTPHSRALRQRTSLERRQRILAAGGLRLDVLLERPAADALRSLTADGTTRTEAVGDALLDAAEKPKKR